MRQIIPRSVSGEKIIIIIFFLLTKQDWKMLCSENHKRRAGGLKNLRWSPDWSHLIDGQINIQWPSPSRFRDLKGHFGDGRRSCRIATTRRWHSTLWKEKGKLNGRSQEKKQRDEIQLQAAERQTLDVFPHKTQHGNGKNTNTMSDLHTKAGRRWGESVRGLSSAEGLFSKQAAALKQYSWISSLLSGR